MLLPRMSPASTGRDLPGTEGPASAAARAALRASAMIRCPINQTVVDRALARPHRDFEDALQRECALENGIEILVTRNTRHYPKTDVAILSPADFLQLHGAALALMGGSGPGRPS